MNQAKGIDVDLKRRSSVIEDVTVPPIIPLEVTSKKTALLYSSCYYRVVGVLMQKERSRSCGDREPQALEQGV